MLRVKNLLTCLLLLFIIDGKVDVDCPHDTLRRSPPDPFIMTCSDSLAATPPFKAILKELEEQLPVLDGK